MVGRFAGSLLLRSVRAHRALACVAIGATLFCLTVTQSHGAVAGALALAVGLLNAIMFPTIFTITLERSTASTAATSGLLCTAIVGGAILPRIAGHIADTASLHSAFLVPMVAYAVISLFALGAGRVRLTRTYAMSQNPAP
jgi:FHS family L-fucose permease-like MFS transporter